MQVYANYIVTLVPKDGQQKLVQNVVSVFLTQIYERVIANLVLQGRYLIEVSRITPLDGGNPWRISSIKADVIYFTSNKEFYDQKTS